MERTSRLPDFYKLSVEERADVVARWAGLTAEEAAVLVGQEGLSTSQADHMIENVVGTHGLPLGIAAKVVAGASFAARLVRAGGGFITTSTPPEMIAQIQVLDLVDPWAARFDLLAAKSRLLELANQTDPVIVGLGGGARDLEVRVIEDSPVGPMVVAHLIFDCRDAMGANTVNTAAEALAPTVEEITGGRVVLRRTGGTAYSLQPGR